MNATSSDTGIAVGRYSSVDHCRAASNAQSGIESAEHSRVADCVAVENGGNGIHGFKGGHFVRCTVVDNDSTGLQTSNVGGRVEGVDAKSNGIHGISLTGHGAVLDSVSLANIANGILLGSGLIRGCSSRGNKNGLTANSSTQFLDNVANDNALLRRQGGDPLGVLRALREARGAEEEGEAGDGGRECALQVEFEVVRDGDRVSPQP